MSRILGSARTFSLVAALLSANMAHAELALNATPTITDIRTVLDGPGLVVENLKITKGIKGQYGVFTGGRDAVGAAPILNITDGLFMSTGNASSILAPNSKKDYTANTGVQYADTDLTKLAANALYDPVIIEFDIIPEGDLLNFLLVFGSDEYPEYVCSKYNDVFGLFVSGPGLVGVQNAAFLPGTKQAIAVNNVNAGKPGILKNTTACQLNNTAYFVDNGNGSGNQGTQLDGFTTPLTASLSGLQPKQRYHVKLALADTSDQAYDSAAFFKWLTSTSSTEVDLSLTAQASPTKPNVNGYVDLVYTVTNHTNQPTKLVKANVELPAGLTVLSTETSGQFDTHSGEWNIGAIAANGNATLTLKVKVGADSSYRIPAEITYAFNEDVDSTPYNRLTTPDEDDTAILILNTVTNAAPIITTNGSSATHQITVQENTVNGLMDYAATDIEGEIEGNGLTWGFAGGLDDALFNIDSATGALTFKMPPDFEKPVDQGTNNGYEVKIKVCDSYQACDEQLLLLSITDAGEDRDNDGLSDVDEETFGSNPDNPDTDGDSVQDKDEVDKDADIARDTDKDGKPDLLDTDDDNDGIQTLHENHNGGSSVDDDTDDDGLPNYLDTDDDSDGIPTSSENYNGKTPADDDTDKDGIADYLDMDDDGDNLPTRDELKSDSDGDSILNALDADDDNDGVPTIQENHNGSTPANDDTDKDGTPDYLDTDDDGDSVLTKQENYNGGTPLDDDTDKDGKPDFVDADDDNDNILTLHEDYNISNGAVSRTPMDDDSDKDGIPDYRDNDDDGDGKVSANEGNDPNSNGQPDDAKDSDGDKIPDYLDLHDQHDPAKDNDQDGLSNGEEAVIGSNPDNKDSDGDGLPDNLEVAGLPSNPADTDHDRIPDIIDPDDDGDGLPTKDENKGNATPTVDSDGDGLADCLDPDDDNDGVPTLKENYNSGTAVDDDTDKDGISDYLDRDDDGDTIATWYENYNGNTAMDDDTDKDGVANYLDTDDDNDRLLTKNEFPDPNRNGNPDDGLDTDKDNIHDYIDKDDDNDSILTKDEKPDNDGDGHPADAADDDLDTLVDYLDPVVTPFVRLQLRTFLQGPFNYTSELMEDDLRVLGYVPTKQPYGSLADSFGYTNSPYAASPFGYSGIEALSPAVAAVTGNNAVVDWVLIDVRDATDPAKRVVMRAGVLQRDGDVVDAATGENVLLIHEIKPGNYYVVVSHRNHMAVMTATPVALSKSSTLHDFTLPSFPTYGSNARISNGKVAVMQGGDVNNSGTLIVSGPGSDVNVLLGALLISPDNRGVNSAYQLWGYFATDVNMDGASIYSGPNNDANLMMGNVLMHPNNASFNSNFVVNGSVPKYK